MKNSKIALLFFIASAGVLVFFLGCLYLTSTALGNKITGSILIIISLICFAYPAYSFQRIGNIKFRNISISIPAALVALILIFFMISLSVPLDNSKEGGNRTIDLVGSWSIEDLPYEHKGIQSFKMSFSAEGYYRGILTTTDGSEPVKIEGDYTLDGNTIYIKRKHAKDGEKENLMYKYSAIDDNTIEFIYTDDESMILKRDIGDGAQSPTSTPIQATPTPVPTPTPAPTPPPMTIGQKNALDKAKGYLRHSSFSYSGLIKQLEYEQFSAEDATFAVDNCGADWNDQATKKANSYISHSSFSRDGLISQLEYEGFTTDQAEYGATAVGY